MHKKLLRSREHRVMSGVLGGLGVYFNIDPVILRILFILIVIATGIFPGAIAYIVAVFLVPEEPQIMHSAPIVDDTDPV